MKPMYWVQAEALPHPFRIFSLGWYMTPLFLHIIVSSLLALLLGQEFSHRTISQEVCSGHGRGTIFAGKVISYLLAFNFMIILYPFAGCIRQASRFGLGGAGAFLFLVIKAVLYSFLLNSAVFLPAFLLFLAQEQR